MPRPIQKRKSYFTDAQVIGRIIRAVEMDDSRPKKWRTATLKKLRASFMALMDAPEPGQ